MLESVFLLTLAAGFLFFILSVELQSIVYGAVSLLMWIVALAGHVYIQVPSDTYYYEPAVFGISLGMILITVIWLILQYMGIVGRQRYRI
jgi:hypothetical protein